MKTRCENCGKKIEVETDDKGIPITTKCDRCRSRERERELISSIAGVGKKKRSWWRK